METTKYFSTFFVFFCIFCSFVVLYKNREKSMKYIILVIVNMFAVVGVVSGVGLQFEQESWDFGTIEEDGGVVTHLFELKNKSSKSVVIYNIGTSCGCTTPEYSRKPISAGERSEVLVNFDPKGRPGKFAKQLYIFSSDSDEPYVLTIEGVVNPIKLSMEESYPYSLSGDISLIGDSPRISHQYLLFRAIPRGRLVEQSIGIINPTQRDVTIEFRERRRTTMEDVKLGTYYNTKLAAGGSGVVELGYYIDEKSDVGGLVRDTLDIYVDGQYTTKQIYVRGLIVD